MLISVALLLFQLFACAGQKVTFISPFGKQNVSGQTGHSVTFTWKFTGASVRGIKWGLTKYGSYQIDGLLVFLDQSGVNQVSHVSVPDAYKGRVSGTFTGDSSSGQASFTLSNITKDDERFYACELTPTSLNQGPITDFVKLVLEGPPTITHISDNQTANEGERVMLNCTADGNPPPNITWTRLSSNSRVTFPLVVSRHDEGGYRCSADNGIAIKVHRVFLTVQYAATVETVTPVTSQSWIGQTLKLICKSDGAPTPTLSWTNPSGKVIKKVTELKNTVDVLMSSDQDFGNYTCEATNDINTTASTVVVQQIKAPGSPTVTVKTEATSITVRWTKPADDGGSPITAYRVLILRGNTEIENMNITDTSLKHRDIESLNKSTNYTIMLFARNYVFEGKATERKIQTKYKGVPSAVAFTYELKAYEITLKWEEPNNNGAEITMYTVYYGTQSDEQWKETEKITDVSVRKYVVKVEMGQKYKVLVTASNKNGESSKEGKMQRVDVPEGSSWKTKMVIAGAAGGGGLLLLIVAITIIIVVFRFRRSRRNKRENPTMPEEGSSNTHLMEELNLFEVLEERNYDDVVNVPEYSEIINSPFFELEREKIEMERLLGSGNFGEVYKATLDNDTVAVKSLKASATSKDKQDMITELNVMKRLKPHPHVLKLIGCCSISDPLLIVLEYLPYGDLLGYLRKSRGHSDSYNTGEKKPSSTLTAKELLSFAWMIADGMHYLATMKVIHRDLAARNILVGENQVCKVSDFGLARDVKDGIYVRSSQARLPVKWMPPESLFHGESSTMSDVWSYGIVLWEVFTIGDSPYPRFTARQTVSMLERGYRMQRPIHISEELFSIMSECWSEKPEERPTFKWICTAVNRLIKDTKIYINLDEYNDADYVNFDMAE